MNQSRISGVIITLNEESSIRKCIESMLPVCDEIIVLDSFSTDRTQDICIQLGVKFYQQKFIGYGQQKNSAVQLAQFPFILSLDADEYLSPELIIEIQRAKYSQLVDLYDMPRLTNYCGHWVHHCGWYPDRKIRLWNKLAAQWENKDVHEKVRPNDTNSKIIRLKNNILHYSYKDSDDHLKRIQYYTDLQSKQMHNNGQKFSSLKKYLSSVFRFIYVYFLRLGFLDGSVGFQIARYSALNQYLKYSKLESLYRTQ